MSTMPNGTGRGVYAAVDLNSAAASLRQACQARDCDGIAACLAEQVVAMYYRELPVVGREANRQVWTGLYQAPDFANVIAVDEVVEAEQGDLGYTYGRWWQRQVAAGPLEGGRWVAIWQPVDGRWQITHLSSNSHADVLADSPIA